MNESSLDVIFLANEIKVSASYLTKEFEQPDDNAHIWALRGVSFDVSAGNVVGILGAKGAGKSTLAKIISGVITPTTGNISFGGKSAMVSMNNSFNKKLTGRENIKFKCFLAGLSNKKIKELINEIIEFSDLSEFIDLPVKSYSTEMKLKLAFSIAFYQNLDVLIIDEALSFSKDDLFKQRCVDRIAELKKQRKIIFIISDSPHLLKDLCDQIMWLTNGKITAFNWSKEVIEAYNAFTKQQKNLAKKERLEYKNKLNEEKASFNINHYYEEMLALEESSFKDFDPTVFKQMFFPSQPAAIGKLALSSKLMLALILIAFMTIVIHYVPTRPLAEIISELFSH